MPLQCAGARASPVSTPFIERLVAVSDGGSPSPSTAIADVEPDEAAAPATSWSPWPRSSSRARALVRATHLHAVGGRHRQRASQPVGRDRAGQLGAALAAVENRHRCVVLAGLGSGLDRDDLDGQQRGVGVEAAHVGHADDEPPALGDSSSGVQVA
ncbi:MAG: hypothetical protein WKF58_03850 [Ilumatobacteraceae bacterium]